jgi:hypothetical protein
MVGVVGEEVLDAHDLERLGETVVEDPRHDDPVRAEAPMDKAGLVGVDPEDVITSVATKRVNASSDPGKNINCRTAIEGLGCGSERKSSHRGVSPLKTPEPEWKNNGSSYKVEYASNVGCTFEQQEF